MKRLMTILIMLGFLIASAGVTPAFAKHKKHWKHYHGHYARPVAVKYVARPYYRPYPVRYLAYPAPYYNPYYVPARRLYVSQPVVYPTWYVPPPSLFNLNLRL